jgi:hypothetical protein
MNKLQSHRLQVRWLLPAMLVSMTILLTDCNNGNTKTADAKADTTTKMDMVTGGGCAIQVYTYRIGIDTMIGHAVTNKYQKLILGAGMDVNNPELRLDYYEAKSPSDRGAVGTNKFTANVVKNAITLFPTSITFGNCELPLDDYIDFTTYKWKVKFDYLLFTPVVENNNLAYDVTAFSNGTGGASDVPVALPSGAMSTRAKPSPPARPAKINPTTHTTEYQAVQKPI